MNCIFLRRGYGEISAGDGINYVEYIESSGTQYIDTEFKPNQDTRVVLDCEPTTTMSAQQAVFGARNSNSGQATQAFGFNFMSSTSARLDYMGSNSTISGTYSSGTKVSVDVNKNTCTVNGNTGSVTAKTGQSQYNMFLFNVNNYGSPHSSFAFKGKIYFCQIYDNGTLVRDYKPALDPDGVACLYDELSKTYYYNAGTGTFTAGASISGGGSGGGGGSDTPTTKEYALTYQITSTNNNCKIKIGDGAESNFPTSSTTKSVAEGTSVSVTIGSAYNQNYMKITYNGKVVSQYSSSNSKPSYTFSMTANTTIVVTQNNPGTATSYPTCAITTE